VDHRDAVPERPDRRVGAGPHHQPERRAQFMGSFRRSTMMQVSQFKWVPRPGSNESRSRRCSRRFGI